MFTSALKVIEEALIILLLIAATSWIWVHLDVMSNLKSILM